MRHSWLALTIVSITTFGCCFYGLPIFESNYEYTPPPETFTEADLVGTWQAKYGSTDIDTITLKADGTYQQVFQAPESNYYYEGTWNEWHLEYSASGKPKLHLKYMRYFVLNIEFGGPPGRYYDISEDLESVELTDKVILAIEGDESSPRGIRLWHLRKGIDGPTASFVLVDE